VGACLSCPKKNEPRHRFALYAVSLSFAPRGFGDRLTESWREWVQEQGIGTFALPPSHIEEGLLNRLIPLVENRRVNTDDRILAIRDMGSKGYILGADALLGLLQSDDAIPREPGPGSHLWYGLW
jgi:hypothetical protein